MAQTINDRMEILVNEKFAGNKAAFAKFIGLSPTAISSYLGKERRSKPNIDMVTNIIVKLRVDPMWLLTGETSSKSDIRTEGDFSPASQSGNVSVVVSDSVVAERVRLLEQLLSEKDARIDELKERIEELKAQK